MAKTESLPKRVNLYVPAEFHQLLRDAADDLDTSMSDLVRLAVYDYIESHLPGRKPKLKDWDSWWDYFYSERLRMLVIELKEQAIRLAEELAEDETNQALRRAEDLLDQLSDE